MPNGSGSTSARSAPDLLQLMASLDRTVRRVDGASAFEKLELAPVALAQARALLDALVCEVMALRGALKEREKNAS